MIRTTLSSMHSPLALYMETKEIDNRKTASL
uniref:Uncharacterized protein n=1 Tax=Rhizophora mucronata TaxID=61149 RepID=A0A2P2IZS2_RHIMU